MLTVKNLLCFSFFSFQTQFYSGGWGPWMNNFPCIHTRGLQPVDSSQHPLASNSRQGCHYGIDRILENILENGRAD